MTRRQNPRRTDRRGQDDGQVIAPKGTANALARLHPSDRERILRRVADRRALACLMREPGTLAEAPR